MSSKAKPAIRFSLAKEVIPLGAGLLFLYFISQPSTPFPTVVGDLFRRAHKLAPFHLYAGLTNAPITNAQAISHIKFGAAYTFKLLAGVHALEALALAAYAASKGASLVQIVLWTVTQFFGGFPNFLHFQKVNRAAL
ncbi:hypothetical protein OC846_003902 [Tilletia horrida]|uniref:Uncharacterized protein n=1 Tax=Tilletia horrida TaxID=155126 RepID=A0AAN6GN77_9BASI|nr:hypothetical protein OC846_003902 [Tilletia horrida]KAK0565337.1 hypothetical protein OC861_003811 [Tilletia horrida]